MPELKPHLLRPLHHLAFVSGVSLAWALRQPVRRVLMLHGIGDEDLPVDRFQQLLTWLARRFEIVSLDVLIQRQLEGRAPRGELALTFDDGLKNQVALAYPVLARRRIPATFFVCPGLIERGAWLWNHQARARLLRLNTTARVQLACRLGGPAAGVEAILAWMKTLPQAMREDAEARLRDATPDFLPSPAEQARYDPVTWEDLRALDPHLIAIGSHTMSHLILPTLDRASVLRELVESRAWLEHRLGRVVDLFCYPNGARDVRVRATASRVYRAAVTTEAGLIGPGADLLSLARIPVDVSVAHVAWRLHRPAA